MAFLGSPALFYGKPKSCAGGWPLISYKMRGFVSNRKPLRSLMKAGACALGFICIPFIHPASAQLLSVAEAVLHQPSLMTRSATSGLITSIANAGSRLVAVGQEGRILLSDDNGKTWTQVETPTSVLLTRVAFASVNDGWAVGQMGVILHTSDAGEHWKIQFDGSQANQELLSAAKVDASVHPNDLSSVTNVQSAEQFVTGGPSVPFLALLPISTTTAVVGGGFGMAFETADGGGSWQPIFDQIPNPNGFHFYSIIDDGDHQLWAGEQGLAMMRDRGGKFTLLTTPFQGTFFGALRTRPGSLIMFGLQGTVLRSSDDGRSWKQIITPTNSGIDSGIILRNGDILLGDVDGSLLMSRNDGLSFSNSSTSEPIVAVAQANDSAIIISGPLGVRVVAETALDLPN